MSSTDHRINRLPKVQSGGTFKTSTQALDYAKRALDSMHQEEVWTLAERLDDAMEKTVEAFVKEIRS